MPKLKTHKGAKRRFHITGTGKVMHRKGGISHHPDETLSAEDAEAATLVLLDFLEHFTPD